MVFDALDSMFGSSLSQSATEFLELILQGLQVVMNDTNANTILNIFLLG